MDIDVYNKQFQRIYVFDTYESLIWVDKYYEPGTFEIYTPVNKEIIDNLAVGNYIKIKQSEHTMIIEDFTIETNIEEGNHIKIIGRSLESILDRRIVWKPTTITGNLQKGIKSLIKAAFITGAGVNDRKISNFKFQDSTDTNVTKQKAESEFNDGENLLDVIITLCKKDKIGFKIILDDENNFVFSLYSGTDRSYKQETNPYVVFMPSFDNIIESNYIETTSTYKNVAQVVWTTGTAEQEQRHFTVVGTGKGLDRREIYVDGSGIKEGEKDEEGQEIDFDKAIEQKGKEALKENKIRKEMDGKCETTRMFTYGKDFFLGDILQVSNEYGIESSSRVTEFTYSHNNSGLDTYPTFETVYEEDS